MKPLLLCVTAIVLYICPVLAGQTYSKSLEIIGPAFYDEFSFDNSTDPTHGRVKYVDQRTAQQYNLTYATDNSFVLRADYKTYLMPSDHGRKSVRIKSRKKFSTFLAIFDIRHMPEGCGTWPAVWTVGDDWPDEGEIDIIEGVNNKAPNTATLHTGSNCSMSSLRDMTGRSAGQNCAAYETANTGCGVVFSDPASFGPSFNVNGGGWYVMERTNSDIKIFFWSRHNGSVPVQVELSHGIVEPDSWILRTVWQGQPAAAWSNDKCDIPGHFGPHNIVINLTFCGDWAGAAYPSDCPDTCEEYVNANPDSFFNAYFDFSAIRIYT